MARKEKKEKQSGGLAPWLVTLTDIMTLLLTFFVLIITFASFLDPRRVKLVMGSITGTFGIGTGKQDVLSQVEGDWVVEEGPMPDDRELQQIKPLLWDDKNDDLNFIENRFVQIFSINTDILYEPGQTVLTQAGEELLDRVIPVLNDLTYPVLLAGHTSPVRDELGNGRQERRAQDEVNPSWDLSLHRVLNVYRYLIENNVDPDIMRLEAFGEYAPRYSNRTQDGRRNNRRVEIILDKRNPEWTHARVDEAATRDPDDDGRFIYRDFIFDVGPTERRQ
ncbi:OmpA/MotB family protein [Desulfonatronovibrio magnus]|uniref:OmpA/MotB family protein n=1 Tax=Desulfonatronovibrio magnus TaxID=698827 RepID=UPI0005EBD03B|nr:OmpA family protein [Desulfonatronovibrio magnus]